MRPSLLTIAVLLMVACDQTHPVRVVAQPGALEGATRVDVSLLQACPTLFRGTPAGRIAFTEGTPDGAGLMALGDVPAGTYALMARAWNDECELTGAGCSIANLQGDGSEARVIIEATSGPRCQNAQCTTGRCVDDPVDGGALDSGNDASDPIDGGPADSGSDTNGSVDGSTLDAPPTDVGDAAPVDVGTDVAPDAGCTSYCDCLPTAVRSDVIVCMDAETGGQPPSVVAEGVGINPTGGLGGTQGFEFYLDGADVAQLDLRETLSESVSTIHLRFQVQLTEVAGERHDYISLAKVEGGSGSPTINLGLGGDRRISVESEALPALAFGEWQCVSMSVSAMAGGTSSVIVQVDASTLSVPMVGDPLNAPWQRFVVGTANQGASSDGRISQWFMDDIVFSTTPIGCE